MHKYMGYGEYPNTARLGFAPQIRKSQWSSGASVSSAQMRMSAQKIGTAGIRFLTLHANGRPLLLFVTI
jgi:hypothetical protein